MIVLGTAVDRGAVDGTLPIQLSLPDLLTSRLLVQATSGAGKTWFLRRLLEQTHGHVQHLVIDPEGEFAPLRERFDYVLAAKEGGDTLAHPRSAKLLAERLLELRVSAILDIYELKMHDRVAFVQTFLETLVDAPKSLWHPTLIVLDEAHRFAPQGKTSEETSSTSAVINLAAQGRKRGFALVAATQRLSKLHKDVAAELGNKLIGRTSLDVDLQRAADEIGIQKAQWSTLQNLGNGEFFAFGPAFAHRGVARFQVGETRTKPPKVGSAKASSVPPPTDTIRALLPQISDLPAEAERKAETEASLRKALAEAQRALRAAEHAGPAGLVVTKPLLTDADRAALAKVSELLTACRTDLVAREQTEAERLRTVLSEILDDHRDKWATAREEAASTVAETLARAGVQRVLEKLATLAVVASTGALVVPPTIPASTRHVGTVAKSAEGRVGLTASQRRILSTVHMLLARGLTPNREMLARWMGIHPNGGRYGSDLAELRRLGHLDGFTPLTDPPEYLPSGIEAVRAAVDAGQRTIIDTLQQAPSALSREALAEALGIHPNGGRYGSNLAWLRTMGVIPDRGLIHLTPEAFA